MNWQPINTAPELTNILVYGAGDGDISTATFSGGKWYGLCEGGKVWVREDVPYVLIDPPTHWMPLPDKPEESDTSIDFSCTKPLEDEGCAVVVFTPAELRGADPSKVEERLIELGWEVIDFFATEPPEGI